MVDAKARVVPGQEVQPLRSETNALGWEATHRTSKVVPAFGAPMRYAFVPMRRVIAGSRSY